MRTYFNLDGDHMDTQLPDPGLLIARVQELPLVKPLGPTAYEYAPVVRELRVKGYSYVAIGKWMVANGVPKPLDSLRNAYHRWCRENGIENK